MRSWKAILCAVTFGVIVASVAFAATAPTTITEPSTSLKPDLPLPAQAAISATLGRDQPAYHAVSHGKVIHLGNPRHAHRDP